MDQRQPFLCNTQRLRTVRGSMTYEKKITKQMQNQWDVFAVRWPRKIKSIGNNTETDNFLTLFLCRLWLPYHVIVTHVFRFMSRIQTEFKRVDLNFWLASNWTTRHDFACILSRIQGLRFKFLHPFWIYCRKKNM